MSDSNRQLPRFIPTLTEVVEAAAIPRSTIKPKAEIEAVIDRVQRQVQPIFERRLQEEFDRLLRAQVTRQWADASGRIQGDLASLVRQIVLDELMQQNKANPDS
jgi:hypothetical protein